MPWHVVTLLACTVCLITWSNIADAFEDQTHMLITQEAADVSSIGDQPFDQFLKASLGLTQGLRTPFADLFPTLNKAGGINTIRDWLALGAIAEDMPFCRSARHFHDPLLPWNSSGLVPTDPLAAAAISAACGASSFPSSVRWAQSRGQDAGMQRSWFDARNSYFNALTGQLQANRDQEWANALQALGQVMHLVVDASVPEHVRNDTHLLAGTFRRVGLPVGSYEWWVETNPESVPFAGAPRFDRAILQQPTNDALAPVPIARLFDTDAYTGAGSGPGVTLGPAIGIAEFANANFFSEDTGNRNVLSRNYPYPALDLLAESQHPAPVGTNIRRYYKKGGDGLPVDPALAECVFDEAARAAGLPAPGTYNCVDENVWQATAAEMVPRAVDYAAGVLEYFFRGQIEIAPPARYVYGLSAYQAGHSGSFTKLRFKVRNATPGEDTGPGTLTAVVQYRKPSGGENLINDPTADLSDQLYFARSSALAPVTLTADFQEVVFDFSGGNALPANSADLFLTVVFRGRLGLEDDAVMVGGKDLFEPDPIDIVNASDWEYFDGTLYYVAASVAYPPYHPPGQTQRDVDHDGVQDLTGPAVERNTFLKAFDVGQPVVIPSETNFDFTVPTLGPAQFTRVMALQDQPFYGVSVLSRQSEEIPSGIVRPNEFGAGALQAVRNDYVLGSDGNLARRVSLSAMYRGVPIYHTFILATSGTLANLGDTSTLPPDLSRIPGAIPVE